MKKYQAIIYDIDGTILDPLEMSFEEIYIWHDIRSQRYLIYVLGAPGLIVLLEIFVFVKVYSC